MKTDQEEEELIEMDEEIGVNWGKCKHKQMTILKIQRHKCI